MSCCWVIRGAADHACRRAAGEAGPLGQDGVGLRGNERGGHAGRGDQPQDQRPGQTVLRRVQDPGGRKVQITFSDVPGYDDFVGQMLSASSVADAVLSPWTRSAASRWAPRGPGSAPESWAARAGGRDGAGSRECPTSARWSNRSAACGGPSACPSRCAARARRRGGHPGRQGHPGGGGPGGRRIPERRHGTRAETDDALVEKYLGGESLTPDEFARASGRP